MFPTLTGELFAVEFHPGEEVAARLATLDTVRVTSAT
jgi:hypothetical protein